MERCHHMSIMKNSQGVIKIAHFALAFGEPHGTVEIILDRPDGYTVVEGRRYFTPEEAIELGEELILRAKKARACRKRWERQHVEMSVPLNPDILDKEDRGAELLPEKVSTL